MRFISTADHALRRAPASQSDHTAQRLSHYAPRGPYTPVDHAATHGVCREGSSTSSRVDRINPEPTGVVARQAAPMFASFGAPLGYFDVRSAAGGRDERIRLGVSLKR
jgi:hypothetical protein